MKEHHSFNVKDACIIVGFVLLGVLWYAATWPYYLVLWLWKKAKRTLTLALCLSVASCLLQGCGTVGGMIARTKMHNLVYRPYIFTSLEALYLWSPFAVQNEFGTLGPMWVVYPAFLIDLPFTAVTDTVMLPVDISLAIHNMGE